MLIFILLACYTQIIKMIKSTAQHIQNLHLPPLPTIKDLIKLYKLRALKQLSQNFLLDLQLTNKIVRAAGNIQGGEVMEVGPGPGGISRSILLRNPKKVILVEKDPRFIPALQMLAEASPCPMKVYKGDVLTFNMEKMFGEDMRREWSDRPPNIHLIGNLPFSVATLLIILWLEDISQRSNAWQFGRVGMTLTFQKEVAERMAAPILTPQRCRLSIMCQNWCYVNHKFDIPGRAFLPKPDVDVGVVKLVPLETPVINLPFKLIEKVVRCVFSFRQKYCIRGAETLFPKPCQERLMPELFGRAEVNPEARPYQLTLPEFGRICHAYQEIIQREPKLARYDRHSKTRVEDYDEDKDDDDDDDVDVSEKVDNNDIYDNRL